MKLGVFSVVFGNLRFEAMLERVREAGLECVEIGTGAYPGSAHCDVEGLLVDPARLAAYRRAIEAAGLSISALSCPGNPLHPNKDIAAEHRRAFERTVRLAERLEVPVIVLLSGCPGDSPTAKYPNWCHFAWPPDFVELWNWQWNEVAIPYWREAAAFASAHGIRRLAVEMHPGFLVYNPETALKLREAVGENLGVNFDPSHLFWSGVDIPTAVHALKDAIFHCHAKDTFVDALNVAKNGCLDGKPYADISNRSWSFRTVGWGHGLEVWRSIVSAMRATGYDYVLSIEHEDPLASRDEGLRHAVQFLRQAVFSEPAGDMWWA
ncbi:MAG: sugar phosphate isomerase/epimerase [Bryobacteraceae bacterium]